MRQSDSRELSRAFKSYGEQYKVQFRMISIRMLCAKRSQSFYWWQWLQKAQKRVGLMYASFGNCRVFMMNRFFEQ